MIRLLFGLIFFSFLPQEPSIVPWETLADVKFVEQYFEEDDAYYLVPTFGPSVVALEGREITMKGYLIEIDPATGFYVLSKNPNSSCFFCGGAGPETIVELDFKKRQSGLRMDAYVTVQGSLKLNVGDVYHCNYILESPKLISN